MKPIGAPRLFPPQISGLALAELEALRDTSLVSPSEAIDDLEAASARFEGAPGGADRLRLPPPPVRAVGGVQLRRGALRVLEGFRAQRTCAVSAPAQSIEREARLQIALGAIVSLQGTILSKIARGSRA